MIDKIRWFLPLVFRKSFVRQRKLYKRFYKELPDYKDKEGHVLMYVGIGNMFLTPLEILIYHILRNEGWRVDYVVYDDKITLNEVVTKERWERLGTRFWKVSARMSKALLKAARVEFTTVPVLPNKRDEIQNCYKSLEEVFNCVDNNVDLGNVIKGTMYRYYKSLTFGDDALKVAREFMVTASSNLDHIRDLTRLNSYDYVFMSHGIYCTWQPIVEHCRSIDLDFVCYDRAKVKGTFNFNMNNPSPVWDISKAWSRLIDYELNHTEKTLVDTYLKERELQKGDVYSYNFRPKHDDISALKKELGIPLENKVITIFTNLIWDAANVSRDIAFDSPLECIVETIKVMTSKLKVSVVIRTHPAEDVLGTGQKYTKLILDSFEEDLPENVVILDSSVNVNSFTVLDLTDIGVVHTSTVGLELAIEGKPVILISDTHYRDKGFTIDVMSREHYFNQLHKCLKDKIVLEDQVRLAKKYFYLMMFEYQHKMPLNFDLNGNFIAYSTESFMSLIQNSENPLQKLIGALSNRQQLEDFVFRS